VTLVAALAATLAGAAALRAHDVPSDVRVRAFLRPDGSTLRLLVRVPAASMNDVAWPMRDLYLDLSNPALERALRNGALDWIAGRIDIFEGERRLTEPRLAAVRVSLPSEPFDSYDAARAGLSKPPLPGDEELPRSQAMVDALFEYGTQSDRSRLSIEPRYRLLGLRTLTVLTFINADGLERTLQFHDDPGLVRLEPRWHQAAWIFLREGFSHIATGVDHLLFLLCLVVPLRRMRALFWTVTAFIVAHAITLVAASYEMTPGAGWFPPLVQLLMAVMILYLALENIAAPRTEPRWMIAFGGGLVHGLELAVEFRETLQLAGAHVLASLVAFNVGAELAQLAALALVVPVVVLLFRFAVPDRAGTIVVSALIAHTAWHWTTARAQTLWRYQFGWPDFTAGFFADAARWLMVAVAAAGAAWMMKLVADPRRDSPPVSAPNPELKS
jgi:hypothetical protein